MGTIGGSDFDEDVDQTASVAAITPLDQSSNLMDRMDFVATPSSEFKRPPAPHNTPVANVGAISRRRIQLGRVQFVPQHSGLDATSSAWIFRTR